jgi:hypothetical protein
MKRLTVTQHAMRCPLNDASATLTVRTDVRRHPSGRYVDVTACSLFPSVPFTMPSRAGYFSDVAPPLRYLDAADAAPRHSAEIRCAKRCLATLNAAEPGAADIGCTSGVNDALELARQGQPAAIMRLLWLYGG